EVTYHNIRLSQKVDTKFELYLGVDNLFGKLPPFGLLGNGAGDAIFPNAGRFLYAGFRVTL
ncbi:MAG: hypothetical protein B7Z43_03370, partial [Sphingomonas sp. 12-62-6]